MQHLKRCLNPKVVAALAAVAIGVWVFAPGALAGALPLLIVAICPLSMIGMMYMMRGGQGATSRAGAGSEALQARVAELEARLAVESRRDETQAAEGVAPNAAPHGAD